MKILRWICGKTKTNKIKNDNTRESAGVVPIEEKMVENKFRWFERVERKPINFVVRRVNQMKRSQTSRGRERLRKIIRET